MQKLRTLKPISAKVEAADAPARPVPTTMMSSLRLLAGRRNRPHALQCAVGNRHLPRLCAQRWRRWRKYRRRKCRRCLHCARFQFRPRHSTYAADSRRCRWLFGDGLGEGVGKDAKYGRAERTSHTMPAPPLFPTQSFARHRQLHLARPHSSVPASPEGAPTRVKSHLCDLICVNSNFSAL